MICDLHSHFLPGIDDGAKRSEDSVKILKYLKANGIETVCATPHYSCNHEPVSAFLARRERAFDRLNEHIEKNGIDRSLLPRIILGAEVRLCNSISELAGVDELCIGSSRYILLEPPFEPYNDSVLTNIDNIRYQYDLIPVMAHINRYLPLYKKREFEDLFYGEGLVLQINCECTSGIIAFSKLKKIIKSDLPCVFGCDIHSSSKTGECGLEKMKAFIESLPEERKREFSRLEAGIIKTEE